MNQATSPQVAAQTPAPLVIRTGWEDCHAHFHAELYQLVLHRQGREEKVDLGFSGSRLLERLLRFPGEVVPREELLAHAWSDRVVGQGSLNQQVYTLRQLLGDEKKREIIQTLPRRGYMFNPKCLAPLEPLEIAQEPAQPAPPAPTARLTPKQRHLLASLGCATALIGLGLLLLASIQYALFQNQVVRQEHQMGPLHFTFSSTDEQGLSALMSETTALTERLAALAPGALQLRLGKTSGFYELLCSRGDDSGRWLMIHERQLAAVDDALLRSCLP